MAPLKINFLCIVETMSKGIVNFDAFEVKKSSFGNTKYPIDIIKVNTLKFGYLKKFLINALLDTKLIKKLNHILLSRTKVYVKCFQETKYVSIL